MPIWMKWRKKRVSDTNERIKKIKFLSMTKQAEIERRKLSEKEKLDEMLNPLKERIVELLKVANELKRANVKMTNFEAESFNHNIGLMRTGKLYKYIGYYGGGFMGDLDLYVNEEDAFCCSHDYAYQSISKAKRYKPTYNIQFFARDFEIFESNFYNFVDNLLTIKDIEEKEEEE